MSNLTKRLSALLLAGCLLLTGCAEKDSDNSSRRDKEEDTVPRPAQTQKKLSQEELDAAMQTLEFSAIAAAAAKDEADKALDGQYINDYRAFIGDIDEDGAVEMVYGWAGVTFDPSNGGSVSEVWEQSGNTLYTDKEGNLYLEGLVGGDSPLDGLYYVTYSKWYKKWDGHQWNNAFSFECDVVYYGEDPVDEDSEIKERTAYGIIEDKEVTEEEYNQFVKEIGLRKVDTTAADMTVHSYDIAYKTQLLDALDAHLSQQYSNYKSRIVGDFDKDGVKETLFLIPDLLYTWKNNVVQSDGLHQEALLRINENLDLSVTRTGVILADPQRDTLNFRAFCINDYLSPDGGVPVVYNNSGLYVDGYSCHGSATFTSLGSLDTDAKTQILESLVSYLQEQRYKDPVMKLVDVADTVGEELLCLCEKDGTWYLLVFIFRNGAPLVVWNLDLSDIACYLVEKDGKQCLMTYYQRVDSTGSGYHADYSYNLRRFDANGEHVSLEYNSVSFTEKDSNASHVSQFFDAFNRYIVKVIVVGDPYALTNQQWLPQDQVDLGTVPENTVSTPSEDPDAGKLGFVQIEDPESWLNLREGPGTEYKQVLMDPHNPNSFVKQALGSPVTVLEEIETGDEENPVWVKIRIHYGDREVIGYSSKRFIRMAE